VFTDHWDIGYESFNAGCFPPAEYARGELRNFRSSGGAFSVLIGIELGPTPAVRGEVDRAMDGADFDYVMLSAHYAAAGERDCAAPQAVAGAGATRAAGAMAAAGAGATAGAGAEGAAAADGARAAGEAGPGCAGGPADSAAPAGETAAARGAAGEGPARGKIYPQCEYGRLFDKYSKAEAYSAYLRTLISLVDAYDGFDALGHFDYISRYSRYNDPIMRYSDFAGLFDALFGRLVSRGKGLEINTATYRRRGGAAAFDTDIARRYAELGGELLCLGSDAHRAADVGGQFGEFRDMLRSCGVKALAHFEERRPVMERL
jgi:histidinol phosphatase-like PHP family hydrolase